MPLVISILLTGKSGIQIKIFLEFLWIREGIINFHDKIIRIKLFFKYTNETYVCLQKYYATQKISYWEVVWPHTFGSYKFLFTIYCQIVCLFFPLRFSFPYYTTSSEGSVRIEFYSLYISIFCVLTLIKPNQLGTARTRCTFLINRYKFIILLFCFT